MVEIAAETCEKLSQMDQEQQSEIAALGTEYITLAKVSIYFLLLCNQ